MRTKPIVTVALHRMLTMSSDQRESKDDDDDTCTTVEFVTGNPQLVVLSGKLVYFGSHNGVEEGRDMEFQGQGEKQEPEWYQGKKECYFFMLPLLLWSF